MASTIDQLFTRPTLTELKTKVIETAEAVALPVTDWIFGEPSERWTEIIPRVVDFFLSSITSQAVRGFFLDYATDPGDDGDPSTDQTPRPGWLSALGLSWYGVGRGGQTFATTTITVTNDNAYTVSLGPGDLTVQRDHAEDDGGTPTYTTTEDDSVYVNADGTVTVLPGNSVELEISADVIGTYSDANGGEITVLVTGSFGSLSVTNDSPARGRERQPADEYREECRRARARVATGGPTALYEYAARRSLDGSPLQRHDGSGPVAINKIFVDDALTTSQMPTSPVSPSGSSPSRSGWSQGW